MALWIRNNRLYLDFYCYLPGGKKSRCREALGLTDNNKNRSIAQAKDKAIEYELKHGRFDYLHFFPYGAKAHLFRQRPGSDMLFSTWWDEWLEEKSIRYNTALSWGSAYKVHIGPHFGHLTLPECNEHELLVFRKKMEGKSLKASSINDKIMKPLCMCLLAAQRRGHISAYPCGAIKRLTEIPPDIDPFSFEELLHFLEVLKGKQPMYHDMVLIWSRTGLRPNELCALKWMHIDRFHNKALIRENRLRTGTDGPPKTSSSIRDVDLRPAVMEALDRQWARTGLMDSYVFMTRNKGPFSDAFLRKKFHFLLALAKLKYRPPKQLRHTFATLHIAAGENITWVSKMLGHASVEVTLKRYNRFVPNLTREDGTAFERIMDAHFGHNQVTAQAKVVK